MSLEYAVSASGAVKNGAATNATGAPDGVTTEIGSAGHYLVLTLSQELPTGTSYSIYISGRGGSVVSDVWEAPNGTSLPTSMQSSPSGFSFNGQAAGANAVITTVTKVTQVPTRYLYFDRGSGDIEIDAVSYSAGPPPEICNNGIDDDGDGLVDCEDCADCTSCSDNDNDGINDLCDLDDDNDGIPDLVECTDYTLGPELVVNGDFENGYANWTSDFSRGMNNYHLTNGGCPQMGWVAISGCATRNGSCSSYFNYTGSTPSGLTLITDPIGVGANVISPSPCNLTWDPCLPMALPDHTSGSGYSLYVDPNDIVGESYWKQQVTVEANTTYEFSAWIMVIEEDPNLQFKINGSSLGAGFNLDRITGGSDGPDVWQKFFMDWFSGSTSGVVTLELVNLTAGCYGNDLRLDDVSLRSKYSFCDADGDGIPNQLDLDSDNDGIFDLVEAGHSGADANNNGIIDGSNATFGSNGLHNSVETSSDSDVINYTVADSENSPDGIIDAYELDSDGDGCFDTIEQNISDSDEDGFAGSGTPNVYVVNGLVTTATYSDPSNTNWQNPSVALCLVEICNDGIDNDLDGLTDCDDDTDCPIPGLFTILATNTTCGNDDGAVRVDGSILNMQYEFSSFVNGVTTLIESGTITSEPFTFSTAVGIGIYEIALRTSSKSCPRVQHAFVNASEDCIGSKCGILGRNLVVNGEFDDGNVGFATDYNFAPYSTWGSGGQYGYYSIVTDNTMANVWGLWAGVERNDPINGSFLAADPSGATGVNDDLWRQTIDICPNQDYVFSAWAKNIFTLDYSEVSPDPNFSFYVNGILLPGASFSIPQQTTAEKGVWIQVSGLWNSGSATTAELRITNNVSGTEGNDMAIDGIYLGLCGNTVSIAPDKTTACYSETVTLSADAVTVAGPWNYYEWYRNGVSVASGSSMTIHSTADLGVYELYAYTTSNASGCANISEPISIAVSASADVEVISCPENCTNGVDDDGDGLADCDDDDCPSSVPVTTISQN